jgi:hypothetical protein
VKALSDFSTLKSALLLCGKLIPICRCPSGAANGFGTVAACVVGGEMVAFDHAVECLSID